MRYPREVVEDVRLGNDIVDVIGGYTKLTQRGNSYMGLCPFHREKTPSFSVSGDNQLYHCFGCGASGNVIGFIMQKENYDFVDALKFLADRIHYNLPEENVSEDYKKTARLKERLYEIHKKAARHFYENLSTDEGKLAVSYLDSRMIDKRARIKFGLGYSMKNRNTLSQYLLSEGYSKEELVASGLVFKNESGNLYDKFYERLMFPIIDTRGNIIGFGGRILAQGEPKYLNSPATAIFNKSENLYNLNNARLSRTKHFVLVEGYMDVISVFQAGVENVVAALGTAFNADHAKVLKRYANSVTLLFDSDEAGVKAVFRAIPYLIDAGIEVKVLQVTNAKDPDEFIKRFGPAAFARLLETAQSHIVFRIEQLRKDYNLREVSDRVEFTKKASQILAEVDNAIEKDAYAKEISALADIELSAIQGEIAKLSDKSEFDFTIQQDSKKYDAKINGVDDARKSIINLVAINSRVYMAIKDILSPEELLKPLYSKALRVIYDAYAKNKTVAVADIVSSFDTLEEQKLVSEIFILQPSFKNDDNSNELEVLNKAVNDQLKLVKDAYFDDKISKCTDIMEVQELINRKKSLSLNINLIGG